MGYRKELGMCIQCNTSYRVHNSNIGEFCSNRCQRDKDFETRLQRAKEKKDWSAGWAATSVRAVKCAVVKEYGPQCSICKRRKWLGEPIPLVMDHVDGNSDNWKFENIRLVCGNCDMTLPTYKSRNKGKGRHARRVRYQKGQSY